jgi:selenophosphate synthetase-related protein
MMLESSGVGAEVNLDQVPVPAGLTLLSWLKMYPGMGFVVTARPENVERVLGIFSRRGLTPSPIGLVTEERTLKISSGTEQTVLFDLQSECVTGIR